jgi:hypothetical protein
VSLLLLFSVQNNFQVAPQVGLEGKKQIIEKHVEIVQNKEEKTEVYKVYSHVRISGFSIVLLIFPSFFSSGDFFVSTDFYLDPLSPFLPYSISFSSLASFFLWFRPAISFLFQPLLVKY